MPLPTVAALAWVRAAAPPPPPGCLLVRPVPSDWSRSWHRRQVEAFPAPSRLPSRPTAPSMRWKTAPGPCSRLICRPGPGPRPSQLRPCRLHTALPRNREWADLDPSPWHDHRQSASIDSSRLPTAHRRRLPPSIPRGWHRSPLTNRSDETNPVKPLIRNDTATSWSVRRRSPRACRSPRTHGRACGA